MNNPMILDDAKYQLFVHENEGWQHTIKVQVNEIPAMLALTTAAAATEAVSSESLFLQQLLQQQHDMEKLDKDIAVQQKKLASDYALKNGYEIDAFCNQDILRDRIKAIEKAYIDLKCSFMKYVSLVS